MDSIIKRYFSMILSINCAIFCFSSWLDMYPSQVTKETYHSYSTHMALIQFPLCATNAPLFHTCSCSSLIGLTCPSMIHHCLPTLRSTLGADHARFQLILMPPMHTIQYMCYRCRGYGYA